MTLKSALDVKSLEYDFPFKTNYSSMSLAEAGLMTTGKVSRSGRITGRETASSDTRALVQGFSRSIAVSAEDDKYKSETRLCTVATQTNEGQIVSYPYQIGRDSSLTGKKYMELSYSDCPAIQLNTEDDDVVVWFTLFNKDTNCANIVNDVTNNYYIYNKKNVTYSGIGTCQGVISDDECKLFVNTMVAAYRATAQATEPVVTNRDKSAEENKDCLYVDFDASVRTTDSEATQPIGDGVKTKKSNTLISGTAEYKTFGLKAAGASSESPVYYKQVDFALKNYSVLMKKAMTVHYYPVVYVDNTHDGITDHVKVVLYDFPLVELDSSRTNADVTGGGTPKDQTGVYQYTLETYEVDKKNDTAISIRRTGNMDTYEAWPDAKFAGAIGEKTGAAIAGRIFPYSMPEGKTRVDESLFLNDAVVPVGREGLVSSDYTYYADIPISKNYYDKLFEGQTGDYVYTYRDKSDHVYIGTIPWTTLKSKFGLDENSDFEIEIQVVMRYGKKHSDNIPLVGTRGVVFMKRGMFTLD